MRGSQGALQPALWVFQPWTWLQKNKWTWPRTALRGPLKGRLDTDPWCRRCVSGPPDSAPSGDKRGVKTDGGGSGPAPRSLLAGDCHNGHSNTRDKAASSSLQQRQCASCGRPHWFGQALEAYVSQQHIVTYLCWNPDTRPLTLYNRTEVSASQRLGRSTADSVVSDSGPSASWSRVAVQPHR